MHATPDPNIAKPIQKHEGFLKAEPFKIRSMEFAKTKAHILSEDTNGGTRAGVSR